MLKSPIDPLITLKNLVLIKLKKPNTDKAKKPDAHKDIKPDARKDIKPHLKKMIDDIKRIFECVICEEFINEKFVPEYMFRDEFELISKYREDTNESYSITASRKNIIIQRCDMPACDVTKYKMYTIHIEHDRVTLEAWNDSLYDYDDILLQVCNDKVVKTTSRLAHENNIIVEKDITEEIEYANRIRYVILRKITSIIFKISERTTNEVNKNKNKNKNNRNMKKWWVSRLEVIKYSKNIWLTIKVIVSQDFGENKYSKNIWVTTQLIVSQDSGGNKYSKNIWVAIQIIVSQDFGGNKYSKVEW